MCDSLIASEVAAGPPLSASILRVQLALSVAVGVLLASARATESLFLFEVLLDGCEHLAALRAH